MCWLVLFTYFWQKITYLLIIISFITHITHISWWLLTIRFISHTFTLKSLRFIFIYLDYWLIYLAALRYLYILIIANYWYLFVSWYSGVWFMDVLGVDGIVSKGTSIICPSFICLNTRFFVNQKLHRKQVEPIIV